MSFDLAQRLQLLEGKVDVITREVNTMLNQLSQTVVSIIDTHRLFTQFVAGRLDELQEAVDGKSPTIRESEEGKEL
jgi:hypothetical protein